MAIAAVAPLTAIALFFADSELWMRAALGVLPIMFGVDLMLTADAGGARCPRCRAKARALP
jgi:cadmium resistance protein CadD (predicted permease)